MAAIFEHELPLRLLKYEDGAFSVFDTSADQFNGDYDILSHVWGDPADPYECGIDGVGWAVPISKEKLGNIMRLMESAGLNYLWVDCICINQDDKWELSTEMAKMYRYYKNARRCHALIEMDFVWSPQEIVDNLKFIDHIVFHMEGAAMASEARLTDNLTARLNMWAGRDWAFPMDRSMVRSAGIELGLLNCYSTSMKYVRSLFNHEYFSRVWTFQEILLGKNIAMWGINHGKISHLGELDRWMDLAIDCRDKAIKLQHG